MKHFMIQYQFANGTTEEWHRESAGSLPRSTTIPS